MKRFLLLFLLFPAIASATTTPNWPFDYNPNTQQATDSLYFPSAKTLGIANGGIFDIAAQTTPPAALAGHIRIFADSSGKFAWIGTSGYIRSFDGSITANRSYTLPDVSGTIVTTGNLSSITGALAGITSIDSLAFGGTGNSLTFAGGSSLTDNGSGGLTIAAAGAAQNVTVNPTGSGYLIINNGPSANATVAVTRTGTGPSTIYLEAYTSRPSLVFGSDTANGYHYASLFSNGSEVVRLWDSGLAPITAVSGAGVAIGGGLNVAATTPSTNTTSGAVIAGGGGAFGGAVYSAGTLNAFGAATNNLTSGVKLGFTGGAATIYSFGANSSTQGTFNLQAVSSDGSLVTNVLTITAPGNTTVAGTLTANGTGISSFAGPLQSTAAGLGSGTGGLSVVVSSGNSASINLNQSGVAQWAIYNKATSGTLAFQQGGSDLFTIATATGNVSAVGSVTIGSSSASNIYLAINGAGGTTGQGANLAIQAGGTTIGNFGNQNVIIKPSKIIGT